jgi:hypothetical protein
MLTDSAYTCQYSTFTDESSSTGLPSVGQYVRRMLLVSDNTAYSRMYEFLTPEYINKKLWSKGYPTTRIRIRFDIGCLGEPNNHSNPIRFVDSAGGLIYSQPEKVFEADKLEMPVSGTVKQIDLGDVPGKMVTKKDFSGSNFLCLSDAHEMLKNIIFPEEALPGKRFNITKEDYSFLWKYLQMTPHESDYPSYPDREHYIDSYKKYFYYGQDTTAIENTDLRILNVVGQSYGYTTESAYIVDFNKKVEFMLSAVYYVTEANGTIDASESTYNLRVMPFFKNLGQVIYDYETCRPRAYKPDLSRYKFNP